MLFFVANFLFPIFLIVICLGLGLFIRLILKKEQKLAITIVEGFALLISIGYLLTLTPQFSKLLPNTILAISLLGIFTNISFLTKIFQQTNQLLVLCVSIYILCTPDAYSVPFADCINNNHGGFIVWASLKPCGSMT